ncbi:MAG TPA: hypothetical protein VN645_06965 [Steroidobacteraceae bacterium]|nr:hypothetical protein [Steroidobacteraceae bacterium]
MKPHSLLWLLFACAAPGYASPPESDVHFQTSDRCAACHNGLVAPSGERLSIGHDWSVSAMANSARDPYWQASVRRETLDHPKAASVIEDECAACHMPIPRYRARMAGHLGSVFAVLSAAPSSEMHRQGMDGVSCSVCHQLSPDGLGGENTWNGQFLLSKSVNGRSLEYGPFPIDSGLRRIMRSSSGGFEPTEGEHIRQSELCASCHTLRTQALAADGSVIGSLPEQMPFLEWRHSRYANERSCQSCHMPVVDGPLAVSRVLGEPRPELARHFFIGANFFLQSMLARYADALSMTAPSPLLTAASARTVEYLSSRAATLEVATQREGTELRAHVQVTNLGGHKLPTAYPSRRAWLHIRVIDAAGRPVFESGALRPDGSIVGNDNDVDPLRFEPHYQQIRSEEQVQIYESVLGDASGRVTTGLLGATHYLKDNRLLPAGFDKFTASEDIRVVGEARDDAAFDASGHRVDYVIEVSGRTGPFTVEAQLLYQPISYRWAHNLSAYNAPEPRRFVSYYESLQEASATILATTRRIQN